MRLSKAPMLPVNFSCVSACYGISCPKHQGDEVAAFHCLKLKQKGSNEIFSKYFLHNGFEVVLVKLGSKTVFCGWVEPKLFFLFKFKLKKSAYSLLNKVCCPKNWKLDGVMKKNALFWFLWFQLCDSQQFRFKSVVGEV